MVAQPYRKDAAKPQAEYEDPTIEYPYEDGEPLAETDWQYVPLTETVSALRAHFSDRADVYVAGDMFVYYRMNVVQAVVAPDVYVVFGAAGNHKRNSWFIWREGATPAFVMEIAAEGTWRRDANEKRDIYAEMGVIEYWRFDPTGTVLHAAAGGRAAGVGRVPAHRHRPGRRWSAARAQRCSGTGHLRAPGIGSEAVRPRERRVAAERAGIHRRAGDLSGGVGSRAAAHSGARSEAWPTAGRSLELT